MQRKIKIISLLLFCFNITVAQIVQLKKLNNRQISTAEVDRTIIQLMDTAMQVHFSISGYSRA
jgi:hypothetical protein